MDIFSALSAPFPPDRVSWRVGSTNKDKTKGMALAFIDARDVMERLDCTVGPGGWQCSYPHAAGKTVCRIMLKIDGEWVAKEDGAGDTDVEAEKGALSDAFKRAAVRWGIGRYLYDLPSPWVVIEQYGRSYRIADSERAKLAGLLRREAKVTPAKAAPLAQAEDDPFSEPPGASRLVAEYQDRIRAIANPDALIKWWNSAERKEATRDFGLSQEEVDALKGAVISRKAELDGKVRAA